MQSSETSKERQEAFLNEQCKEIEERNRRGNTRDLFKKIGNIKETCHPKMGTTKYRRLFASLLSSTYLTYTQSTS